MEITGLKFKIHDMFVSKMSFLTASTNIFSCVRYSLLLRQPSETCKRLYMYYRRFFRGFHQHRTI